MKITSLKLEEDREVGLSGIEMSRLSSVVLIAGKNGAGKSRLLRSIKKLINNKPTQNNVDRAESYINRLEAQRNGLVEQLRNLQPVEKADLRDKLELTKKNLEEKITNHQNEIAKQNEVLNWCLIKTDTLSNNYSKVCVDFVPTALKLSDCNAVGATQMRKRSDDIDKLGIGSLNQGTFAKIQVVQDRWYETSHPQSTSAASVKLEAKSNYERLCEVIYTFLGVQLDRNDDGDASLFEKRLGECALSEGQSVLLQLCIAIYSQAEELDEVILFLDEPENHLHPAALIEIIESLEANLKNGQLWIVTHSIHLLSHFDSSCIWYMKDGAISHSGSKPKKVLDGLIGGDERIGKLSEFLSLPAELAQSRFAFQSLFPPEVIEYTEEDPQANQILGELTKLIDSEEKIKILDFGAGKARLLSAAESYSSSIGVKVIDWLDYYAFDLPDSDDSIFAQNLIKDIYGEGQRYFNNEQVLIAALEQGSFDYIIMCNVFHELEPTQWVTIFNEHSMVRSLIKDDGHLMVVEDQFLPVGEKAYRNGFLVFDEVQFQKLFNIDSYDCRDAREDGRLKAHLLPSSCLSGITSDTCELAIKNLHHFSKQEITRLRCENPNYQNGRLHGFWIQQYANSGLCLRD